MNSSKTFCAPPSCLKLNAGEIHILKVYLDQPESIIQELTPILSGNENMRAERFHFEQDRKRFIVCRGILKIILGRYLRIDSNQLYFAYAQDGKPQISESLNNQNIRFNLSHSEDRALYAFTLYNEIGIDIEMVRDIPEMNQIAKGIFSVNEYNTYRSLPERKKKDVFYKYWTRKEAFCKATGDGFMLPLEKLDVSNAPNEPVKTLTFDGALHNASQWFINDLNIGSGCRAALAIEGQCCELMCFQWCP